MLKRNTISKGSKLRNNVQRRKTDTVRTSVCPPLLRTESFVVITITIEECVDKCLDWERHMPAQMISYAEPNELQGQANLAQRAEGVERKNLVALNEQLGAKV